MNTNWLLLHVYLLFPTSFIERCQNAEATLVFGPRSGGKTEEFQLAPNLAPGKIQTMIDAKILSTETIRPDCAEDLHFNGEIYQSTMWREELELTENAEVIARYHDDLPAVVKQNNSFYIATLTCDNFLKALF